MRCRVAMRPRTSWPIRPRAPRARVAGRVDDHERDGAGAAASRGLGGERRRTPARRRPAGGAGTPSIQSAPGACRVPLSVSTTLGPRALRDGLDAADELHRPMRLELVEDDLDERGPGVRAAVVAAAVAVLLQQALDPSAGRRRDIGPPVEDLRDGGSEDARLLRDAGERDPGSAGMRWGPCVLAPASGGVRFRQCMPRDRDFRRKTIETYEEVSPAAPGMVYVLLSQHFSTRSSEGADMTVPPRPPVTTSSPSVSGPSAGRHDPFGGATRSRSTWCTPSRSSPSSAPTASPSTTTTCSPSARRMPSARPRSTA